MQGVMKDASSLHAANGSPLGALLLELRASMGEFDHQTGATAPPDREARVVTVQTITCLMVKLGLALSSARERSLSHSASHSRALSLTLGALRAGLHAPPASRPL